MYIQHERLQDVGDFIFYIAKDQMKSFFISTIFPDEGTTPVNRIGTNVYMDGQHTISIDSIGFRQTMNSGDCTLDINLETYPVMQIVKEEVFSDTATRYCISPIDKNWKYQKEILNNTGIYTLEKANSTCMVLTGSVQIDNITYSPHDRFVLTTGQTININGKVLILTKL